MLDVATFDTPIDPKGFGGVVLRAANQNQLIAGGNHTIMNMTPPYKSETINYNEPLPEIWEGFDQIHNLATK